MTQSDSGLSKPFILANDNGLIPINNLPPKKKWVGGPPAELSTLMDDHLMRAVMTDDIIKFRATMFIGKNSPEALEKALYYAVGLERDEEYIDLLVRRVDGEIGNIVHGMLLMNVRRGDLDSARAWIYEGVDVQAYRNECLKQALLGNNVDIAKMLCRHGADVNDASVDIRFTAQLYETSVAPETRKYFRELQGDFDFNWREPNLRLL